MTELTYHLPGSQLRELTEELGIKWTYSLDYGAQLSEEGLINGVSRRIELDAIWR